MKQSHTKKNDKAISLAGKKSVSISGNVSQSTINTGDIYKFYGQENQTSRIVKNVLESKIENLSTELSQKVAANLEDLREKFREGNSGEAFEGVRLLRNSTNWDAFEPELRAAILRALASMTFATRGDNAVAEARKLADEARQNNETQNDDVLRARIKTFEEGFEAAIEDFAKINTTESYNLRLNCFLNSGRIKEVLEARENPPAGITLNARLYEASDEEDTFAAFRATLSFVNDEYHFWSESSKLSPEIALAVIWGHATRLYNIQRAVGMEPKNIVSGLSTRRESYFLESLTRKPEFWNDCVYPRRTSRTDFLTQAAANLFAGIDKAVLESLMIPELIRKEVFRPTDNDEVPIPATKLLNDPTLCDDKLQSLFGGDRFDALSHIVGTESVEILKSENLKQSVKTFLEGMFDKPKDTKSWIMIYAVANDLAIYDDLRELCLDVLKNSTADSLFPDEIENPAFILFAAASQIANSGDEKLRINFREIVLETFRKLEADEKFNENLEARATLMDAALVLSYVPNDSLKSNEEFAGIVEKIQSEWKGFANNFGHAFGNSFWNVSLTESVNWRYLNLKLRSAY